MTSQGSLQSCVSRELLDVKYITMGGCEKCYSSDTVMEVHEDTRTRKSSVLALIVRDEFTLKFLILILKC